MFPKETEMKRMLKLYKNVPFNLSFQATGQFIIKMLERKLYRLYYI